MSLISNMFLLFVVTAVLFYYIVPKKLQWIVLLIFSYLYYVSGNAKYLVYILFSTCVTYLFGRWIDSCYKQGRSIKSAKKIVALGLVLNLGMLGMVKYTNFFVATLNLFFRMNIDFFDILFPLGISFYTFQTTSYLLDVYWQRIEAERNPFKYALFVSFFPQLMQGPIGKWDTLGVQLFVPHDFDWYNIRRGVERIIWGLCKKMILSDWAGMFVDAIWSDLDRFNGIAFFGLILYGIELYGDFSGAMDIVIGIGNLFGIDMDENFRRPYLATSMADFWKRWHMTLGRWMENYVFYPLTLSPTMQKFFVKSKKLFGRRIGRTLPIAFADVVVFFLVGIWHGVGWKYVVYGMSNGLIIGFSELMRYTYRDWRKALHIKGDETWYHIFQIVRTYIIVNLRWFFDRSDNIGQGVYMIRQAFTHFNPAQILTIPAGNGGTAFTPWALLIIAVGCIIMVTVGCLQEKGVEIRKSLNALPWPVTLAIFLLLLIAIGMFGSTASPRGFIYAQF